MILLVTALSAWAWVQTPAGAPVPVEWNDGGEVVRTSGKFAVFLLMPIVMLPIHLLFLLLPRIEPRGLNLRRSRKAYVTIWLGLLALLVILHALTVINALGHPVDIWQITPILMGALFILLGNYMGKIRSNFFVGIKTPWTLSSERAWNKTHRLGGWLFVLLGLLFAVAGYFVGEIAWLVILVSGTFATTIFLAAYSYVVWKNDPQKHLANDKEITPMEPGNLIAETKPTWGPVIAITTAIILLTFAVCAWAWLQVPTGKPLPVHWNIHGEVDRYSGKFEALLLMPLIALGIQALLIVIPLLEPRRLNLQRSWKAYAAIWIGVLALLAAIYGALVLNALGQPVNPGRVAPVLLGLLFVVLGNYMGKIRSNFFVGIRTPWTLSSERAWNKTHRLGGWVFLALGLLIVLVGLLADAPVAFVILMSGVIGAVLFLVVYSYIAWKQDPEKQMIGRR